ncbi:hypothetical protein LTR36_003886 [Oleoguttula mirabilis]|uniref:UPF3 domain-containing protein n=1 Tax=Oleoguttula mirabilis TaxID=1507867 RepID=A0AAV9JI92_9PEZI|nr:hypothetical protein LTR36_003886 [Oleoguttula mirabilis]
MPPKVMAKNGDRGVLPINAAARAAPARAPAARLKLEMRRLPPGLTLTELEEIVGAEWKLGSGRVDWREYRQGKLRAPGKLPEQSRCYLHLANERLVKEFEQRFLDVVFHDKAGTHKNPDLKHLPPTLGFAPNQRTSLQARQRADNRQGTIDQDPEFIAFLEAETQPVAKASAVEPAEKTEKVGIKSTPLIDDLREKKANKAKAAAPKADVKKDDGKKGHARSTSKDVVVDKTVGKAGLQTKIEQAAKDAAKVLTKQAAAKATAQQQQPSAKAASPARPKKAAQSPRQQNATPVQPVGGAVSTTTTAPSGPAPNRTPTGQRQRANAEGIKKMLQKDLGIRPKPAAAAQATAKTPQAAAPTPPSSAAATQAQTSTAASTAPKANAAPKPTSSSAPTISATKAYLKHANPSQGMTEMLILRSLSEYGECTNVTIDPRKGTAIAVFKDSEGLKKAMDAKRVPVANGAVEVLEFREVGPRVGGPTRGRGGFRGGRGGGRGGAAASSTPAVSAAPTPPASS